MHEISQSMNALSNQPETSRWLDSELLTYRAASREGRNWSLRGGKWERIILSQKGETDRRAKQMQRGGADSELSYRI